MKPKKIISRFILFIAILAVAMIIQLLFDYWTVPVQNEVTVAQIKNSDESFVTMKTTNSALNTCRMFIMPTAFLVIVIIVILDVKNKKGVS